jgi:hypothetical protein
MVMRAKVAGALLAEDPEAQRGALCGGRKNAKVLHDGSGCPPTLKIGSLVR